MIHPEALVHPDATIGQDCIVERGAVIGAGARIGNDVHIGANTVCVDPDDETVKAVSIQDKVQVGANVTLYPGVNLGAACVVRHGAVVTRSVPAGAIVEGHPAYIVGYVNAAVGPAAARSMAETSQTPLPAMEALIVRGVTLHRFPVVPDLRGSLSVGEFERQIPFVPMRYFLVFGVPSREVRGEHAHRECHQFLLCVRGTCSVVADDGHRRAEVVLDAPNIGLYLPPMTWGIQYKYSADALLLVFASHHYDPADYIRDYRDYLGLVECNDRESTA